MIFFLKKMIAPFLCPMPICLGLSFAGLYLLWFTARQRAGKILISVGIGMLYLLSCGPAAYLLLRPLERKYPQYHIGNPVKFIVVLGGWCVSDPQIPVTSQLSDPALSRLAEGLRIYRNNPGSKFVFTGMEVSGIMANAAKSFGVDKDDIITESEARDTKDEAKAVKAIVRNEPFVLVTTASHMPRSMALLKKQGMNPIPAPTRHLIKEEQILKSDLLYPSSSGLHKSERAFYEYLGLLWAKLRGQV